MMKRQPHPAAAFVFVLSVANATTSGGEQLKPLPAWDQAMTRAAELSRAGRYAAAESVYLEALSLTEPLPQTDPRVGHTYNGLCAVTYELGRAGEAEKYCTKALREQEKQPPTPLSRLNSVNSLHLLVTIHLQSGRVSSAKQFLTRFEDGIRSLEGVGDPIAMAKLRGILHYDLGFIDFMMGRMDPAETSFRKALTEFLADPVENVNVIATTLSHLSSLCIRRKAYTEAESYAHQAVSSLTSRYGPNHPEIARDLHNLAIAYLSTGRPAEAEKALLRALPLLKATFGPEDASVGNLSATYAKVLRRMGRKEEARKMSQRAEEIARLTEDPAKPGRFVIDVQSLMKQP